MREVQDAKLVAEFKGDYMEYIKSKLTKGDAMGSSPDKREDNPYKRDRFEVSGKYPSRLRNNITDTVDDI